MMTSFLTWLALHGTWYFLALLPSLPIVALSLSFRRIVDQKTTEVIGRLTALDPELWGRSYGNMGTAKDSAAMQRKSLEGELSGFYNWRTYYIPLGLTCLVAFGLALVTFQKVGLAVGLSDVVAKVSSPALIAAGGAYLWGLNDLIQRHRSSDISSSALHTGWLRILLSGAVGALLGSFTEARYINAVAFMVGGLPIEDLKRWLNQKVNIDWRKPAEYGADIHLIQGMNKRMMDRLLDEEIDSVQALAFADPVRLLFRTNIEWNVILDLIDQAMLVSVVGERVEKLRGVNVRCAIELASLYQQTVNGNAVEQARAQQVFRDIAQVLGVSSEMTVNMGFQLYFDPLLEFIWGHWSEARRKPDLEDDDDTSAPAERAPHAPSGPEAERLMDHARAIEKRAQHPDA